MKRFLPFPLLVLFFWGCQKATFEYAVICEFPPVFSREGGTTLVITDDQGDVVGHFPIATGSTGFNQKFNFQARNASEKFGLHLIVDASNFSSDNSFNIYSHCGVPNGASVTLRPDGFSSFVPGSFRFFPVKIRGVSRIDSILLLDQQYYFYPSANGDWITDVFIERGQTHIVRIFANGDKVERTFWLKETTAPSDTLRLNFNDLNIGYKTSGFEVQLPADKLNPIVQVDMISPDYKDFIRLAITATLPSTASKLWVSKPETIPNDWLVYVRFTDTYSNSEQIFKPGEPLVVTRPAGFGIVSAASEPGQSISVKTEGEVDLIRVSTFWNDPDSQQQVNWNIDGDTETFKYLELPELKRFLPNTELYSSAFKNFRISLYNLENIDYAQVRRGFPWRSGGIYPVGRSKLRVIHKNY